MSTFVKFTIQWNVYAPMILLTIYTVNKNSQTLDYATIINEQLKEMKETGMLITHSPCHTDERGFFLQSSHCYFSFPFS